MTTNRSLNTEIAIKDNGFQAFITDLQPLSSISPHNHTQLWYGTLHSNQNLPKNVVVKVLTSNYTAINLANLQQELTVLHHCQNIAIDALSQKSGIPMLYASNLMPFTDIFEKSSPISPLSPCIVMSYHNGYTLKSLINSSQRYTSLTFREKITIFLNVCELVNRLHQLGIIHLDIKPSNFIIKDNFEVVMIDFGLGQFIDELNSVANCIKQQIAGTPAYMSPEQLTGQSVDQRSDYYSLGIVFYELLTGTLPFHAYDLHGWAIAHCQTPVPYLVPNELVSNASCKTCQSVIDKLMAKQMGNRTDSLEIIIITLQTLLN